MENPKRVLFLCTGNSCRSQMAEAFTNQMHPGVIEAFSAGVAPKEIDPLTVRAMAEMGLDISGNSAKDLDSVMDVGFDLVITLCDNAKESCPLFPGTTKVMHMGFPDPPVLAEGAESEEEAMAHYRRVRDAIKEFVFSLPAVFDRQD